ncbi:MAG TPA: T9SS type A sorting domain-containing protein [Chitinophagales bacterium]|nr:T9SS type A sorting domain-containing protein [Chitinophagales bacterium]HMX04185.1 T9SS type A sorting domain-containing protein [Chitinophagales bacterium]HNF68759.1 T9SS type A sorting domain-containing protein [Chitinophagales bacterium]HNI54097.1 T9SS type A sorting domain-containing protein [Chitinophagales bacterium]HNJ90282.1 T9SS type A sorting domain-containing protein [Chitinophagales bacterium]
MKKLKFQHFLALAFLIGIQHSLIHAQIININWQQTAGGTATDGVYKMAPTSDGGVITGGYTYSGVSGNKTDGTYGMGDYWVVKYDASGNLQWQKTYGGTGYDKLEDIVQTSDGGYLLGGYSNSPVSGNKTEGLISGSIDIWVIKIDAAGTIVWQNDIGGNQSDYLGSISETADGGCIVGAYSSSPISGDKTEGSKGLTDYWIIKLNSTGAISWQNTIGGSASDYCFNAAQTADGGYLISGDSNSPVSFDKTESYTGVSANNDIWLLKLDAAGNIIWQNVIGGTGTEACFEMCVTTDGGAILAAQSDSPISGDKTENTISGLVGDMDFWAVKVSSLGAVQWDNTLGGTAADYCHGLTLMPDGGYALAGYTLSPAGGDITVGSFLGTSDYWVVRLAADGTKLYDRTLGGSGTEYCYDLTTANDGKLIVGGTSSSSISGDKTSANYGVYDFWIVKLSDACYPSIEICNAIDDDCDGLTDDGVVETISIAAGGATIVCQGTPVVLTATHTGTSLQWKKNGVNIGGATGITYSATQTGNYSCTTTSACGTATSSSISVTVNKNPKATISAGGPTSFCAGGSVTLTETPSAGCSYQWYQGATPIAGATSTSYVVTTAGNYKCRVTKIATGCFKNSNGILVTVPCREGEELLMQIDNGFALYPNPASENVHIDLIDNINPGTELIITDAMGNIVLKQQVIESTFDVSISLLPSGMYVARIINGQQLHSKTMIIQ